VRTGQHQRGVAMVVLIAIFAIVILGVLTTALARRSVQAEFDDVSMAALSTAKAALIAYAAGNNIQPGRLPCADQNGDGIGEACGGGGFAIGRLPWRDLGLPILRDGSGECLWYAVSSNFINGSHPLNSDSNGVFTVHAEDDSGATPAYPQIASQVVAVIFAPGPPRASENRSPAPSDTNPCGGSGSTPANYLDQISATQSNANPAAGGGAHVYAGTPSPTFNDRLVYITVDELFPAVERRVAAEIKTLLQQNFINNGYYPFAHDMGSGSSNCTNGLTKGLLPVKISDDCSSTSDWLPQWMRDDQWYSLAYYAVAPGCISGCASGTLRVDNAPIPNNNKKVVIIMMGRRIGGQLAHPCTDPVNCLEGQNADVTAPAYETQPRSLSFNDTVVTIP
jgi:type II secretory pathway pseudopilin PulG